MKWTLLLVLPSLVGCQTINAINRTQQPKFKEVPYLLNIQNAQEIIIRSPQIMEYNEQGQITKVSPVLNEKGKPILASFKIKDQTFEQPKGIWDFGGALVRAGLAYLLGKEAFDVIETGVKGAGKVAFVDRETTTFSETIVTPNPSGSFQVDNFRG